ncbi:MAG TPA: response regulator [Motiliproteus sp.]
MPQPRFQHTLLVIDDSPSARFVVQTTLESQQYQVFAAEDGETGLELVAEVAPELILLDINMPGISGFEVCKRLKANPCTAEIPVIFLSANNDADSKVCGFACGGVDFVTKPFQADELLARVAAHLALRDFHRRIQDKNQELEAVLANVHQLQSQLIQSEKMASLGTLAAGVAHEINNPIGYVTSNFSTLKAYAADLFELLELYAEGDSSLEPGLRQQINAKKQAIDFTYLRDDLPDLINESQQGLERVKTTVQNLKNFTHAGTGEKVWCDLCEEIENTLNVVWNEIKYKADVIREYSPVPPVYAVTAHIGQVVMNLLVNAAHAIEEKGVIRVATGSDEHWVWVEIRDNGVGMSAETRSRIFDPFYTTKPLGKGTGLGLSLSLGIIEKHQGKIEVSSEPGEGSCFRVLLPREPE